MSGRETDRFGMFGDLRDADALPRPEHFSQQALAKRLVGDSLHLFAGHAEGDKSLQPALIIRDAKGCIPGVHQVAGGVNNPPQHTFQREIGE